MIARELQEIDDWIAASDSRREEIVQEILNRMLGFELVGIRSYRGPDDSFPEVPIATLRQQSCGVQFNLIPGGHFSMGFSERQADALRKAAVELYEEEAGQVEDLLREPEGMQPVHSVQIPPFLLARFPLRPEEAALLLGLEPGDEDAPRIEDLEIAGFEEEEIAAFLKATGYSLPSEAQWEYACRAGSDALFWWGDQIPDGGDWMEDWDDTAGPDQFANRFGLVNMVAYPEVCADLWHSTYNGAPTDGSAWTEKPDEQSRVVRGGAALYSPWQGVGEWLAMLSAERCASDIPELGLAIRPVLPLPY